jgi:hypothetical protein
MNKLSLVAIFLGLMSFCLADNPHLTPDNVKDLFCQASHPNLYLYSQAEWDVYSAFYRDVRDGIEATFPFVDLDTVDQLKNISDYLLAREAEFFEETGDPSVSFLVIRANGVLCIDASNTEPSCCHVLPSAPTHGDKAEIQAAFLCADYPYLQYDSYYVQRIEEPYAFIASTFQIGYRKDSYALRMNIQLKCKDNASACANPTCTADPTVCLG